MTEHFVTLFNSKFLPQGLSLNSSMKEHILDYKLWVICLDMNCYEILRQLNYEHINAVLLSDFETEELLSIKAKRTFTEYCWTLTPFSFKFVFSLNSDIKRLTYLDADMFFFDNPKKIYKEFEVSKKNVLITPHNYSPFYDQSKTSGRFCVQFLIIERDSGEAVRLDWEKKCSDWCFNRFEDDKFGDQKYLDAWPTDFADKVHVLVNREYLLAPWNILNYSIDQTVLFHFHGTRILNRNKVYIGNYLTPQSVYTYLYKPYLQNLHQSMDVLKKIGFTDVCQRKNKLSLKITSLLSLPYFIINLLKHKHIIKI